MDILMSIRPQWVELIRAGRKTCELRKRPVPAETTRIYVYETVPVQAVCGYLDGLQTEMLPVDRLWERTKDCSCVGREAFDAYYGGAAAGCAIFFRRFVPIEPAVLAVISLSSPPQSWMRLSPAQSARLASLELLK